MNSPQLSQKVFDVTQQDYLTDYAGLVKDPQYFFEYSEENNLPSPEIMEFLKFHFYEAYMYLVSDKAAEGLMALMKRCDERDVSVSLYLDEEWEIRLHQLMYPDVTLNFYQNVSNKSADYTYRALLCGLAIMMPYYQTLFRDVDFSHNQSRHG